MFRTFDVNLRTTLILRITTKRNARESRIQRINNVPKNSRPESSVSGKFLAGVILGLLATAGTVRWSTSGPVSDAKRSIQLIFQ